MDMLDFICNGSVDLFGTGRERKIQNENLCLQQDSNPHTPVHDRKVTAPKTARPRGLDGDRWFNVLQDNGIQFKKYCYVTTRVNLIMVTCAFELNVRLIFHYTPCNEVRGGILESPCPSVRPSVRPSVCPAAFGFPADNCFPFTHIIMKLHMQTPHESRMCAIDFEVKRSKVKVTMHKLLKMVSGA